MAVVAVSTQGYSLFGQARIAGLTASKISPLVPYQDYRGLKAAHRGGAKTLYWRFAVET
jgi:hypothetical protein